MLYLIEGYGKTGKLLKIGYSQDIEVRMNQFRTNTLNFKLLATREGDEDFETKLQSMIHPHPSGMHVDGLVILGKKDQ